MTSSSSSTECRGVCRRRERRKLRIETLIEGTKRAAAKKLSNWMTHKREREIHATWSLVCTIPLAFYWCDGLITAHFCADFIKQFPLRVIFKKNSLMKFVKIQNKSPLRYSKWKIRYSQSLITSLPLVIARQLCKVSNYHGECVYTVMGKVKFVTHVKNCSRTINFKTISISHCQRVLFVFQWDKNMRETFR